MRKSVAIMMSALISLAPLGSAAMAQNRAPDKKIEEQSSPKQQVKKKHQWKQGGKYNGNGAAVANHSQHGLKAPRKGYRWIRDGNDFILVATATGVISSIVRATRN